MVRSLHVRSRNRTSVRFESAKGILRDVGPWLAVIAGFAAIALLFDFCFACLRQAMF